MANSLESVLLMAFPVLQGEPQVTESQILDEPNPLMLQTELPEIDVLPFYMAWCVKSPNEESLVSDGVLDALATFGRTKKESVSPYNVRAQMSDFQRKAIVDFLDWFRHTFELYDKSQFERTVARWRAPI